MKSIRALAVNLLISAVAVLVTALLLEIGLSIAKVNTRSIHRFVPGKGFTYVPGAHYVHTKEGFSEGYFNSHGFRDSERTVEKRDNAYRIAVFGDSFTEALQVDMAASFPAILERELGGRFPGTEFEVLNLGQSGFGTTDALMRYRHFGAMYSPDMVILAFAIANDFRNNHRDLNAHSLGYYFVHDEDAGLVLDASLIEEYTRNLGFAKRAWQAVKRRSYLMSLVSERIYLFNQQVRENRLRNDASTQGEMRQPVIDPFNDLNIFRTDADDKWTEAYEITRHAILTFQQNVVRNGSVFVLVALPNSAQVHPAVRESISAKYGVELDYEQPNRMLESIAAEGDIPFLALHPILLAHHEATGEPIHGFNGALTGHWNEVGHRVAADAMLEFLANRWGPQGPLEDGSVQGVEP